MYNFIWNNEIACMICVVLGLLFAVAVIVISTTLRIKEHKRRASCEHEPECTRSKGICMSCLDYKKKGEQKK